MDSGHVMMSFPSRDRKKEKKTVLGDNVVFICRWELCAKHAENHNLCVCALLLCFFVFFCLCVTGMCEQTTQVISIQWGTLCMWRQRFPLAGNLHRWTYAATTACASFCCAFATMDQLLQVKRDVRRLRVAKISVTVALSGCQHRGSQRGYNGRIPSSQTVS